MKFQNTKHKTHPFFVHCPVCDFEENNNWTEIKNFFKNKNNNKKIKKLKNISLITWNNSEEESILEKSCRYFGIQCEVLGKEIKDWKNEIKINLTYNFLKCCNTDYVFGIDAYDAAMIRNIEEFDPNKINNVIFNYTPATFPKELSNYYGDNWKFKHLNAGAWFGKTNFLKVFYEYLIEMKKREDLPFKHWFSNSEQFYIKIAANDFADSIEIDERCNIFQVLHSNLFKTHNDFVISKILFA